VNLHDGKPIPGQGLRDPLLFCEDEQHHGRRRGVGAGGWGGAGSAGSGVGVHGLVSIGGNNRAERIDRFRTSETCVVTHACADSWDEEVRARNNFHLWRRRHGKVGVLLNGRRLHCTWRIALAAGVAIGALPGPIAAQDSAGRLEQRVTAASDTSQSYALYLPPRYMTSRTWPVLFVLDPRGRALLAEKLFEDAAARLGWVVMSSYNTLSDGPPEPNVNAMNAMLASAQRLAIDPGRVYLAGFSGTWPE